MFNSKTSLKEIKCFFIPNIFLVFPSTADPSIYETVSCDFEMSLCGWKQLTDDDYDWTRYAGTTSSASTGPTSDHTTGTGICKHVSSFYTHPPLPFLHLFPSLYLSLSLLTAHTIELYVSSLCKHIAPPLSFLFLSLSLSFFYLSPCLFLSLLFFISLYHSFSLPHHKPGTVLFIFSVLY